MIKVVRQYLRNDQLPWYYSGNGVAKPSIGQWVCDVTSVLAANKHKTGRLLDGK